MTKQIKFTVGSAAEGYKTVEISVGKNISCKILRSGLLNVAKRNFTVENISEDELDALKIFDWEKNYSSNATQSHWELIFKDGEKIYRGGGNAYPDNWEKFLDWLDALIPELEFVNRKRLEKVTLNYSEETLTLDRAEKTLTIDKKNSTHLYDVGDDIKKIFDTCQTFVDGLEDDDATAAQITFEVTRHDKSVETFALSYDEKFLPALSNLLEEVHAFASDLTAEIFSPQFIDAVPRTNKYILCKVQFQGSYKHYTYRTDDEKFSIGDVVDVPVGRFNEVNQAKIVEIGYFDEYELPFPLERIKKIIGKHVAEEWENY